MLCDSGRGWSYFLEGLVGVCCSTTAFPSSSFKKESVKCACGVLGGLGPV